MKMNCVSTPKLKDYYWTIAFLIQNVNKIKLNICVWLEKESNQKQNVLFIQTGFNKKNKR